MCIVQCVTTVETSSKILKKLQRNLTSLMFSAVVKLCAHQLKNHKRLAKRLEKSKT